MLINNFIISKERSIFRGVTHADILKEVATNPKYIGIIRKITRGHHLQEDLFQEVLLILAEYDPKHIRKLHRENKLTYFFIRIVLNNFRSSSSPFYKKYRKNVHDLNGIDVIDEEYNPAKDKLLKQIEEKLESKGTDTRSQWYEKELFKLYVKEGNISEISRKTDISYNSINRTVLQVKEKIQNELSS